MGLVDKVILLVKQTHFKISVVCRNSIERKQDKVFEYLAFLVKGKHAGERKSSSSS